MNIRTRQDRGTTALPPQISSAEDDGETGQDAAQSTTSGQSLSWTVWPMGENPLRSVAVILFLMIVVWAISTCFGKVWIFVSAIFLVGTLTGFFFPTTYRLDPETVSAHGLLSKKKRTWSGLKKYYVGKKGVHLSPYARPSKLESFRVIYLPFSGNQKEIMDFIGEKMNRGR